MRMHNPPHPAATIKECILPELGLTVTAAAKQLGVSCAALSRLLSSIGYVPPAEFETAYYRQLEESAKVA